MSRMADLPSVRGVPPRAVDARNSQIECGCCQQPDVAADAAGDQDGLARRHIGDGERQAAVSANRSLRSLPSAKVADAISSGTTPRGFQEVQKQPRIVRCATE